MLYTSCRFSPSLTGITPSLLQSIYQLARSCQPVTGSKVVNDWLPTKVRGRGRSCQGRPLNGWGRSCACQSELCVTLGLHTLLHCSKTGANETHLSLRSAISLGAEVLFNGVHTHAPQPCVSFKKMTFFLCGTKIYKYWNNRLTNNSATSSGHRYTCQKGRPD